LFFCALCDGACAGKGKAGGPEQEADGLQEGSAEALPPTQEHKSQQQQPAQAQTPQQQQQQQQQQQPSKQRPQQQAAGLSNGSSAGWDAQEQRRSRDGSAKSSAVESSSGSQGHKQQQSLVSRGSVDHQQQHREVASPGSGESRSSGALLSNLSSTLVHSGCSMFTGLQHVAAAVTNASCMPRHCA
jgi:hypothetical protein